MTNKFYSPDSSRADKVHDLFIKIARRYDFLNDLMSIGMHRLWKRRTINRALSGKQNQSLRVLDLCCGTGDLSKCFNQKAPGAQIYGVDFTAEMLRVAQARTTSIPWVQADALQLPFKDQTFDIVSVGYGLRNLADIDQGLREIYRVLQPNGSFVSLDFGKPESPTIRRAYFSYLKTVLPLLGHLFCGDPDTHGYILASLDSYPAQRGIQKQMDALGFQDCDFQEFCGGTMAINFGTRSA